MGKAFDQCGVTKPYRPGMQHICRKRADHVLHPGRYSRQHMDTKKSPPHYWDATDEEITNYKAKLGDTNGNVYEVTT